MLAVYEALNLREGGLLEAFLAGHGIASEVRGGAHHSVRGELCNLSGMLPQVYVLDDGDAERARALIQVYVERLTKAPEGEPWLCPKCGETLEPKFRSCWQCQTEKPA